MLPPYPTLNSLTRFVYIGSQRKSRGSNEQFLSSDTLDFIRKGHHG